ncbi:MAG: ethanolamine utilization protein EutH, partial [Lawsonibacter sp.]
LFFVIGAVDSLFSGKLKLGDEFEKGIMCAGRLVLCMVGFMTLAPVLAGTILPLVAPLCEKTGVDPSFLAGAFLANDSGGAAVAMEMAIDPNAGLFNGYIVGAMLGTSVMFIIPLSMVNSSVRERPAVIYGLLSGLITIPIGCFFGGIAAGFSVVMLVRNLAPSVLFSLLLSLALATLKGKIIPVFTFFSQILTALMLFGLIAAALQQLFGIQLFAEMGDFSEIMGIIGNIAIFLAGMFPLLNILTRVLRKPLEAFGKLLRVDDTVVSYLVAGLANGILPLSALKEMSSRGVMLNVAMLVSASCVFGDHLAFTFRMAPALVGPVILSKLISGGCAIIFAVLLDRTMQLNGVSQ